jgi:hypothetical protein
MHRTYPTGPYDYEEFFNGKIQPPNDSIPNVIIPQLGGHNPHYDMSHSQYGYHYPTNIESIFEQIYALLLHFSVKIQVIREASHRITVNLDVFPSSWNDFLQYYNQGAYFHHRCQGYVESLKLTNAYTPPAINVWVNQLVYPAVENFKEAMFHYEEFKKQSNMNSHIQHLDQQFSEFKQIAMTIIQYANNLNDISPSISL